MTRSDARGTGRRATVKVGAAVYGGRGDGCGARAGVGRLLGARARLRWVHLILGGALLMPYFLLAQVVVAVWSGRGNVFGSTALTLASYGLSLPLVAVTGLFGLVRPMSAGAVRALCGVPGERLAEGPARSWAARGGPRPGGPCTSGSAR